MFCTVERCGRHKSSLFCVDRELSFGHTPTVCAIMTFILCSLLTLCTSVRCDRQLSALTGSVMTHDNKIFFSMPHGVTSMQLTSQKKATLSVFFFSIFCKISAPVKWSSECVVAYSVNVLDT